MHGRPLAAIDPEIDGSWMNHSRKIPAILIALLAAVLFVPLFIFRSIGSVDFWWWMSLNLVLLIGLSLAADKFYLCSVLSDLKSMPARKVFLGILSALLLYGIFFAGNWLARLLCPLAGKGIGQVYGFKAGASPLRIVLLMVLLIGPGEELFWRGFLQRRWQARFGPVPGWLLSTALYALVHLGSGNLLLVLAAVVCGLFWGALYLRYRSVLLVAASHTLWDLLVFIVVPFA
jgi:membrane protease YdiL (CAAX protease family)